MITIKQAADALGVNKDKVKYRVRKLPPSAVNRTGEITLITDEGMRLLQGLFEGNNITQPGNVPGESPPRYVETLERELEAKNRQIEVLSAALVAAQETAAAAQQSAAAAQALHAATVKQNIEDGERKQRHRGIFARFFGKASE